MSDNKKIIMVVDDQIDFVEGVKLILEEEGYEVWTAGNGQQALDKLENVVQNSSSRNGIQLLPDLILADIMMPVMDGYKLYEHTQASSYLKSIPFIFLTAKTGPDDLQYGKELGVEDYLMKPCVPDVLLASVRGQLKHGVGSGSSTREANVVVVEDRGRDLSSVFGSGVTIIIILVGILIIMLGYWLGS